MFFYYFKTCFLLRLQNKQKCINPKTSDGKTTCFATASTNSSSGETISSSESSTLKYGDSSIVEGDSSASELMSLKKYKRFKNYLYSLRFQKWYYSSTEFYFVKLSVE